MIIKTVGIVTVPCDRLVQLISGQKLVVYDHDGKRISIKDGRFIGIKEISRPTRPTFLVKIWSDSFPIVPEGAVIPTYYLGETRQEYESSLYLGSVHVSTISPRM